jgi:hypothetical protein
MGLTNFAQRSYVNIRPGLPTWRGLALLDVGEEAVGVHDEIRPPSRPAGLSKGVSVNPDPSVVAPAQVAGFVLDGERHGFPPDA